MIVGELIGIHEVAAILETSRDAAYKLAIRGRVRVRGRRHALQFLRAEVEAFAEEKRAAKAWRNEHDRLLAERGRTFAAHQQSVAALLEHEKSRPPKRFGRRRPISQNGSQP